MSARIRFALAAVSFGLAFGGAAAGQPSPGSSATGPDRPTAQAYFQAFDRLCQADAGHLWGVSLCGPMLFADEESRVVLANRPDALGALNARGGVFEGRLPPQVAIANTGVDWSGVRWTMLMWPLPQSEAGQIGRAHV